MLVRLRFDHALFARFLVSGLSALVCMAVLVLGGMFKSAVFYIVGTKVRRCGGDLSFARNLVELTLDAHSVVSALLFGLVVLLGVSGLHVWWRIARGRGLTFQSLLRTQLTVVGTALVVVTVFVSILIGYSPSPWLETHGYEGRDWLDLNGVDCGLLAVAVAGLLTLFTRRAELKPLARMSAVLSLLILVSLRYVEYVGDLMPMCIVESGAYAHAWGHLFWPSMVGPTLLWALVQWRAQRKSVVALHANPSS